MTRGYPSGYGPREAHLRHWFLSLINRWHWSRRLYFWQAFGKKPPENVVRYVGIAKLCPLSDEEIAYGQALALRLGLTPTAAPD